MLRTAATRRRPGFTLVELMVSAAVCVLIMAVLSVAFSSGIDSVRHMKSAGDMMDQLRGATTALQADLKAPHLLDTNGQKKKLSDFRWDRCFVDKDLSTGKYTRVKIKSLSGGTDDEWTAPDNGFFRIGSSKITYPPVAADPDGLVNGTGVATTHYIHFTSILSGLSDDDYYTATVGGVTYRSLAAELAYFLEQTPTGSTGGLNLYRLVRRQRLVALNDTDRRDRPWPGAPPAVPEERHGLISIRQQSATGPFFLSTLGELTSPFNRLGGTSWNAGVQFGPTYAPATGLFDDRLAPMLSRVGEDTLLSNVISFEVQVTYKFPDPDGRLPIPANYPRAFTPGSTTDTPHDVFPPFLPTPGSNTSGIAPSTYDSWNQGLNGWTTDIDPTTGAVRSSANVPPLLCRVQAIQIHIRVWDPKLQNARQVTFVQEL